MPKRIGFILIMICLFISCGKSIDKQGANLTLKILPETVTDFLFVKMQYDYNITQDFKPFTKDYSLFVHIWRVKSKEMLVQDDHQPVTPTTQWKKGDHFSYTRELFIPKFLDEFDIDFEGYEILRLTVGLYDPKNRNESFTLFQKDLQVHSVYEKAPEIIYDVGWYPPETNANIANINERNWRWTSKKAVCIIENPRKDSVLIIRGAIDKQMFPDKKVIFKINETVIDEFIPEVSHFDKRYTITPAQLGERDDFILSIETDQSFVPAKLNPESKDERELGMQIFFLYFREDFQ